MPNLNFRAYITSIAAPSVDTSPDDTRAITAYVAGTLRTMAEQIERGGLSGLWQNVAGILDRNGHLGAQYALKWEHPHNTKAENGPPCLPSVREPATGAQAAPARKRSDPVPPEMRAEFLAKLAALLKEYDAEISWSCGPCSDTHGIYDECMTVSIGWHEIGRTEAGKGSMGDADLREMIGGGTP